MLISIQTLEVQKILIIESSSLQVILMKSLLSLDSRGLNLQKLSLFKIPPGIWIFLQLLFFFCGVTSCLSACAVGEKQQQWGL